MSDNHRQSLFTESAQSDCQYSNKMSETSANNSRNATEAEIQKSGSGGTSGQNQTSGQTPKNAKKRKIMTSGQQDHRQSGHKEGQTWTRLTGAPAWDLPPNDPTHVQTFTGEHCCCRRCRLRRRLFQVVVVYSSLICRSMRPKTSCGLFSANSVRSPIFTSEKEISSLSSKWTPD